MARLVCHPGVKKQRVRFAPFEIRVSYIPAIIYMSLFDKWLVFNDIKLTLYFIHSCHFDKRQRNVFVKTPAVPTSDSGSFRTVYRWVKSCLIYQLHFMPYRFIGSYKNV